MGFTGKLFDISDDIITLVTNGIDDIINFMGRQCELRYKETKWVQCPNCVWDNVNKRSSGRPKPNAPEPFPPGSICPVCNGLGRMEGGPVTENVKMLVDWEPRESVIWTANIQRPRSLIITKGFQSDLHKVLRAVSMRVIGNLDEFVNPVFTPAGEPTDPSNIVQGRYFERFWNRNG